MTTPEKEGVSNLPETFLNEQTVQRKFKRENLTSDDFKLYLLMSFGTYKKAGSVAGWSDESRIFQIIAGQKVPQSPDVIKRLAEAWHIDIVILTKLFESFRKEE